jgi:ATP-dependent Lon protease
MLTSSFSFYTKRVKKIHMTGEITLRGKVLPVESKKNISCQKSNIKELFCVMKTK